jgi:haloalkane dehalogenase
MASQPQHEHHRRFAVNEMDYPFEDHWFERREAAMHFLDEGEGFPVLMLHGNPTWSFLYRDVIKDLRRDFRCIAPDYPGFGYSDTPAGYHFTPQEHSEWIAALIEELQLVRYVLLVQDWGGPIGLAAALQQPERLAGIVLLNTWAWKPDMSGWLFSHIMGSGPAKYLHTHYNFFARRMVPAGISHAERKLPEVLEAYTAPFPTPESRLGTWVFPWAISHSDQWLQGIEQGLEDLRDKPVEMVWGMKDMAFGNERYIEHWHRYFPDAPVDRVANASHYLQEDSPERVADGVRRLLDNIEEKALVH